MNIAGARLNQAMHFNGTRWRRVATPDPGGQALGDGQQLTGVSCVSSSNCWAVGSYFDQSAQARLDQALHWYGRKWRLVATPHPAQPMQGENGLLGVWCVSRSDCWAVGTTGNLGGAASNEVARWNGSKSSVSVPNPAGVTGTVANGLRGVECVKASDCWAVGIYRESSGQAFNQALRFNGRKWKLVFTPSPGRASGMGLPLQMRQLPAVACPSTTTCRAVGSYPTRSGETLNEALRFNGTKWSVMPTPDPGGQSTIRTDALSGVACTSARDCWAVEGFAAGNGRTLNQALHWSGKTWSSVSIADPAGASAMDSKPPRGVRVYLEQGLLGRRHRDNPKGHGCVRPNAALERQEVEVGVGVRPQAHGGW